jgi:UDP-N-acetylglucosamine--N-acetylmuramyl-(pentapeptide) pyrophosphoryl-undecaprenol N-acetylglucosamine transferase
MGDAYAAADLVLCRAGSSTLAELTVLGKPSILVPSPNVTDNHQEANARGLEDAGAALVVVEKGLDVPGTVMEIDVLLSNRERLQSMSDAARMLGQPDTAAMVADLIERRFLTTPSGG